MDTMKSRLVICMITNNYTPYSGGVVSSLIASAQALRALGHRVVIITLDFLGNYNYSEEHPEEHDVIRIRCPFKFKYNDNQIAVPLAPHKALFDLIQAYAPDVIHVHHPFLLGVSGLKVAKNFDIPVVFTYHTIYEKFVHHVPLPEFLTRKIALHRVKWFCKKVDALIVPSTSIVNYLKDQSISLPDVVGVIPSGVRAIFNKNSFVYKQTVIGKAQYILLSVSRFAQEKNITFLIDMFAGLDHTQFKLLLVGYGADVDRLKEYAYNVRGISDKSLEFIIKPSKKELIDLYDKADLFVFASRTETQGLVLAESMMRGTPVVSCTGMGVNDIVKSYYNGILVETCKEMQQAIITILKNDQLFRLLQHNAWKTGNLYTQHQSAFKLSELYYSIL